jgi:hypothetical protein
MPELVMNPVRLRALEKIPNPSRRPNVPMIKELADCDE